jgi:hypothetical protein
MTVGRPAETKAEAKLKDITTYNAFHDELVEWANENKFDLIHSDVVEELILRTLGVDLAKTPTQGCRFKESKLDNEKFVFAAVFTKKDMATLGGLEPFRENLFFQLKALSTKLRPEECDYEFEDDLQEIRTENTETLTVQLNVKSLYEHLLPAMKATLLAKPELITYYQRFVYSAPRVRAALQTAAELALTDAQFEEKNADTVEVMTAAGEAVYAIAATAILLHLRSLPPTASTYGLPNLLPSMLQTLGLASQSEDKVLLQPHPENAYQPVTYLTVPADLSDQALALFNRHINQSARVRDDKIEVENKALFSTGFRSELRGMLTLFKDKTLQGHRMPLDVVCGAFYRVGQKLFTTEQVVKDLYEYSRSGRNLINLIAITLQHLKKPVTEATMRAIMWSNTQTMLRYFDETVSEKTSLTHFKNPVEAAEARARIDTYLAELQSPLANLQKQFQFDATYHLPQAIRELISSLQKLRYKTMTCPLYRLSTENGMRLELDKAIDSIDSMINHLVKHQFKNDKKRAAILEVMADKGKNMQLITGKFNLLLKLDPRVVHAATPADALFFSDSKLQQTMRGMNPLFDEMNRVHDLIKQAGDDNKYDSGISKSTHAETEDLSLHTLFDEEGSVRAGMRL